jgi:hypothetical protein
VESLSDPQAVRLRGNNRAKRCIGTLEGVKIAEIAMLRHRDIQIISVP